ncbi:hypothetical protein MTR_5g048720 [Medicago truncatula]|uniref:Uncharacterized protein n=1 Tax=Medicago truncatula TaxID=3880 RepID=A0A072UDQ9_MEDTR|nr:hypothetical protein MTR_5g048720 [Medicago truncatula]
MSWYGSLKDEFIFDMLLFCELRYGREYSRGDMYVVSHKDAKGKFVNEYASQKAELLQVEMQNTQCENEAFFKVFEKEHAGYVRSMGLGITPSRISSPSTRLASSSIESNEKMLKMQAEIDSLKEKASQVDFLKAQVAFLMQVQNSRDKECLLRQLVRLFYEGSQKTLATPTSATVAEQSQLYICDPSNSRNQPF